MGLSSSPTYSTLSVGVPWVHGGYRIYIIQAGVDLYGPTPLTLILIHLYTIHLYTYTLIHLYTIHLYTLTLIHLYKCSFMTAVIKSSVNHKFRIRPSIYCTVL